MYACHPVSHHPPISAFFYISPENRLTIVGELRPKSKFLGNSVSTTMEGENRITLLGKPDDGGKFRLPLSARDHLLIVEQTMSSRCQTCTPAGFCLARWSRSLVIPVLSRTRDMDWHAISNSRPRLGLVVLDCACRLIKQPGFLLWHVQRDRRTCS